VKHSATASVLRKARISVSVRRRFQARRAGAPPTISKEFHLIFRKHREKRRFYAVFSGPLFTASHEFHLQTAQKSCMLMVTKQAGRHAMLRFEKGKGV
jgi:hypothetical protein